MGRNVVPTGKSIEEVKMGCPNRIDLACLHVDWVLNLTMVLKKLIISPDDRRPDAAKPKAISSWITNSLLNRYQNLTKTEATHDRRRVFEHEVVGLF